MGDGGSDVCVCVKLGVVWGGGGSLGFESGERRWM
jgi:hypothetical protein